MKQNQQGRSMIEMLGVLAIIGILSIGGLAGYAKAMAKYRVNQEIYQMTLMASTIRSLWGSQRNYKDIGLEAGTPDFNNTFYRAGVIPKDRCHLYNNKCSYANNGFGGLIRVHSTAKNAEGDHLAFYIKNEGLSENECIEFANQDWIEMGVPLLYIGVSAGPSMDKYSTYLKTQDMRVGEIVDACSNAISPHYNRIAITAYFDINVNSGYWGERIQK